MYDDRHVDSSYGFAAGLLTGMVFGGVMALLFAPKAGSELRSDLNGNWCSMKDEMGRRYRDAASRASAGMETVKERAQDMTHKAQGMAADARNFVQSKVSQARHDAEQATQH
jgi:gas vesicle protein